VTFRVSDKTLYDLEWDRIVDALSGFAATLKGRARCMDLPFLSDRNEIEYQLLLVQQYRELMQTDDAPSFGGVYNIGEYIARASKEMTLEISEVIEVAQTAAASNRVAKTLKKNASRVPHLAGLAEGLAPVTYSLELIEASIDFNKGEIRDEASATLAELRTKVRNLHARIKQKLEAMLTAPEMQRVLQDNYYTLREDRYVLPVRSQERSQVKGIVHGSSQTGQTVFIEPHELVMINNDLKMSELELERETRRILKELSAAVAADGEIIMANLALLTDLDVISAKAHLAFSLDCTAPEIVDEPLLDLRQARHPLLILKGVKAVASDLSIGEKFRVLIVSGVNAGGKTVSLKAMGLITLMTMCGLHVPCDEGSRVGIFSEVVTVMGDEQSISDGLSTFSANIRSLNRLLSDCGERSLLLLDEIIIGTDPQQGAALAQAVMENIARRQARCAVATHYDSLKRLAFSREEFANAAVGFSEELLKPTYTVTIGMPGSSSAFNIARELGLQDEVVRRAQELNVGGVEIETMVKALEREVERGRKLNEELEARKREVEKLKSDYAAKLQLLKSREFELERKRSEEMLDSVRRAKDEVREIVRTIQKQGSMKDANEALSDLRAKEDRLAMQAEKAAEEKRERESRNQAGKVNFRNIKAEDAVPGAWVHISNLDRRGVIVEAPDGRGAALVEVGRLKMRVPLERLLAIPPAQQPGGGKQTVRITDHAPVAQPERREQSLTCDLRGETVDDALEQADFFLDRAMRENAPFVYFIHGHGTGRLKSALRDYLKSVPFIKSFRPGERGEGQDGVTVVVLQAD